MALVQIPTPVVSADKTIAEIASGTLTSGTQLSLTSLTAYDTLKLRFNAVTTSANNYFNLTINGSTSSVYDYMYWNPISNNTSSYDGSFMMGSSYSASNSNLNLTPYDKISSNTTNYFQIDFYNCKSTGFTTFEFHGVWVPTIGSSWRAQILSRGIFKTAAAVTSLQLNSDSSAFTAGNYVLWGG